MLARRFVTAVGSTVAVRVAGQALGVLVIVLLSRSMEIGDYSHYVYALTWCMTLMTLVICGFDTVLVRFTASLASKERWARLKRLRTESDLVCGIGCALSGIGLAGTGWYLSQNGQSGLGTTFMVASVVLPLVAFTELRVATIRGLNLSSLSQLPSSIVRPCVFGGLVAALAWWTDTEITGATALSLFAIGSLTAFLTSQYIVNRKVTETDAKARARLSTARWRIALPSMLIYFLLGIIKRTDILMIGMLGNDEQAGIYYNATRVADLTTFGMMAVASVAGPLIAAAFSNKDQTELQRIVRLSSQVTILVTIGIAVPLLLMAEMVMGFFGGIFVAGTVPLQILLGGRLLLGSVGLVGHITTMTGHQLVASITLAGSALLNVILNLLLIPHWGISGAAAATSISLSAWMISLSIVVYRKLGIRILPF